MSHAERDIVTGAFGFTGRHIARRLLDAGRQVRTLTTHTNRPDPFDGRLEVAPLDFDEPTALTRHLRGADVLYNTWWIRFERGGRTFEQAVRNSRALLRAAEEAGIRRIVHVSIANPALDSPLPYYRGKAQVEEAILRSRLSYAILRPAVLFGDEGLLIHNIAWMLRHLPVFGVPGGGDYRLRPICVEDLAELAVAAGTRDENEILDAVGPETFTFDALVRLIAGTVQSRARILHLPPGLALFAARLIGLAVHDVVLTKDEVRGLMADLLVTHGPPNGSTPLSAWLAQNADTLGLHYASELRRHFR
jgi:uncharacterized protein YbjT (DUF2867 family)